MATSYIKVLFGIVLCCLNQYADGQTFSFPTGMQHNRGCNMSDPDNLTLEGSVMITPEDFIMFQSKVIVQKTMKLCEVDLTTCGQKVNLAETTMCYCTKSSGNTYSVYVRVQPGTTESGFMLQAVVPSHDPFGSLTGSFDIGEIPAKDQHPVLANGTYQIDGGAAQTLLPVQNITVCTNDVKTFKICFDNLEPGSELKVTLNDQKTYTSKPCVEILKMFDFTLVPFYTMTVSYTERNRKRCKNGFRININDCRNPTIPEMITSSPTNVTLTLSTQFQENSSAPTQSSEEYNTTVIFTELPKNTTVESVATTIPKMENVTIMRPDIENVTFMTPTYVENVTTTMRPKIEKVTTMTPNMTLNASITEKGTEAFALTSSIPVSQNTSTTTTEANTTPVQDTTTTSTSTTTTSTSTTTPTSPTTTTTPTTSSTPTTTTTSTTSTTPTPILPGNVCERREGSAARELRSLNGIDVMCDTETDGGRWIVIQRRASEDVDFYRDWDHYDVGFGSLVGNFWFGLRKIYNLCNGDGCELRVDLKFKNQQYNASYLNFKLGPAETNYKLYVVGYHGNTGDALSYANGAMFSTLDKDNDGRYKTNCAVKHHGAWWFHGRDCRKANLNGRWGQYDPTANMWSLVSGFYNSVTFSEMKIRPWTQSSLGLV